MIRIYDWAHILLRFLSNVEDDLYDQTLTDNPIGFGLLPEDDEGNEWFKMTLMNDNGDELSVEDTWSYLSDYIVSVEIIEFVADKEE